MPLVSGVCRTASAPMLSHGGSRLNASKPEANPKTSCPSVLMETEFFLCRRTLAFEKLHTSNRIASQTTVSFRSPRWREVRIKFTRIFLLKSLLQNYGSLGHFLNLKRPPTNDRTCMGWHTRHAPFIRGWRDICVPRR
jgi:hypothetical protein